MWPALDKGEFMFLITVCLQMSIPTHHNCQDEKHTSLLGIKYMHQLFCWVLISHYDKAQ